MRNKSNIHIEASAKNGVALIRIIDRISEWSESNAISIKLIVDKFLSDGVNEVKIYINSAGGSVFEMEEIVNDLDRFKKVTVTVGALAASAATRPLTKYYTISHANSQFMIHKPSMGAIGDEKQIENQLKLLKNTTATYKKAYADKMKKSEDEIEELWANGDYWMNAQEALEIGLIDEIKKEDEKITADVRNLLVACGCPTIPQDKININNKNMDRDELIASLGMAKDATDEQIKAKIVKNKEEAERAEILEADAVRNLEINVETLINKAISDKKITADKKEVYKKLAIADFENTKLILEAMISTPKLSEHINTGSNHEALEREKWTLEDYLEKDLDALLELEKTDLDKFKKLNGIK